MEEEDAAVEGKCVEGEARGRDNCPMEGGGAVEEVGPERGNAGKKQASLRGWLV